MQQAVRAIKAETPEIVVITDVCLCEYTDHGHCGVLNVEGAKRHLPDGYVLNDETLSILQQAALSHARSGADIVAPSGMIDGMVGAIRAALDEHDFAHLPIMSYAVKYASSFSWAVSRSRRGAPKSGDRKSHQMDPANVREALKEAAEDLAEGADFLMVKPASPISTSFAGSRAIPRSAAGRLQRERRIRHDQSRRRQWLARRTKSGARSAHRHQAGRADVIITYHAIEAAHWLHGS